MVRRMARRVRSGSPYEAQYGFCRALRVGDRVLVSGTAPIPEPGDALPESPHAQMLRCGRIIEQAVLALGCSMRDVVRTRMFIVDPADADEIGRAHATLFEEHPPVATMVVTRLLDPAWKVEVEAEAMVPDSGA